MNETENKFTSNSNSSENSSEAFEIKMQNADETS
jgi:hypothetical protein